MTEKYDFEIVVFFLVCVVVSRCKAIIVVYIMTIYVPISRQYLSHWFSKLVMPSPPKM